MSKISSIITDPLGLVQELCFQPENGRKFFKAKITIKNFDF